MDHQQQASPRGAKRAESDRAIDPVCGMEVDRAAAKLTLDYQGETYFFCHAGCQQKFEKNPAHYLAGHREAMGSKVGHRGAPEGPVSSKYICPMDPEVESDRPGACPKCGMALEPAVPVAPATKTEWTCPMHPEIVRDAPGSCPICGMALEPRTVTVEEGPNPSYVDMTRRFWVSVPLALGTLVLVMGDALLPGTPIADLVSPRWRVLLELLLATPVCTWAAWPFYVRAVASVRNRSLNMFTLIGLGVSSPTATAWSPRSSRGCSRTRSVKRAARWRSTSRRRR
jgi:P-type Cu+ transporter